MKKRLFYASLERKRPVVLMQQKREKDYYFDVLVETTTILGSLTLAGLGGYARQKKYFRM